MEQEWERLYVILGYFGQKKTHSKKYTLRIPDPSKEASFWGPAALPNPLQGLQAIRMRSGVRGKSTAK